MIYPEVLLCENSVPAENGQYKRLDDISRGRYKRILLYQLGFVLELHHLKMSTCLLDSSITQTRYKKRKAPMAH